ncbi:MAG: CapA family protein, partial [Bacteroidota bacterium]
MIRIWLLFVTISISCVVSAQELPPVAHEACLKLVFMGDIMGHDTQIASALATGDSGYDYQPCFQYLEPYLTDADLVIGNLEVTLAGPPFKGYPQFSSPDELADALKEAGFDILVTANNHAFDRRVAGLERTLDQLDRRGILHTGTFTGPDKRSLHYPLVVEKHGIRIALLNYTYGTNGLKVTPPVIVNRIDTALMHRDLVKAASAEPDFILVTMHWGNEYQRTESDQQRALASFLFEHGTDVIIGSHPHVVQPIRGEGKGNLVAYSMGNLISNQRTRYRDGGIAFELELVKRVSGDRGLRPVTGDSSYSSDRGDRGDSSDRGVTGFAVTGTSAGDMSDRGDREVETVEISSFGYLPLWVYKPVTKKGTLFTLVPASADSASVPGLRMSDEERRKMSQFLEDTRNNLEGHWEVEPYW